MSNKQPPLPPPPPLPPEDLAILADWLYELEPGMVIVVTRDKKVAALKTITLRQTGKVEVTTFMELKAGDCFMYLSCLHVHGGGVDLEVLKDEEKLKLIVGVQDLKKYFRKLTIPIS